MASGRGKKFKFKGSPNPRFSSRITDKMTINEKNSRIHSNLLPVPPAAQTGAYAPTHQFAPAFVSASASASSGHCNRASVEGDVLACRNQLPGYIFMCNGRTKADCYNCRVFGLPAAKMEAVEKIKPHMKLFLFDLDLKLLYGIYIAASKGELEIEPTAFGGKFSAQVRFEIFKDCLPLPESAFKHVIKENYIGGSKFRQELSVEQVTNLILIFRPIAAPPSGTAVSLMPNAVRLAHNPQHVRQSGPLITRSPHAPMHLLPVVPRNPSDPYYATEAHRVHFSEDPVLHQQAPFRRCTAMPNDGETGIILQSSTTNDHTVAETRNAPAQAHARMPVHGHVHIRSSARPASYWVGVASEDQKQACSSQHTTPSLSTDLVGKNIPVPSVRTALPYPPFPENSDRKPVMELGTAYKNQNFAFATNNDPSQAHADVTLQFQVPTREPAHFPSSFFPATASEDPNQVYTDSHQRFPPGITGMGAGNIPISFSGIASSDTAASQLSAAYSFHHNTPVSAANASLQANIQVPSEVPGPLNGLAHLSSSEAAAYWTTTGSQDPNQAANRMAIGSQDPNQAAPLSAVAYQDPNQAAYWTAVASRDPNQVYSGSHQMWSVNGTARYYDHNLATSATGGTLQAQAQAPSYVAAYPPSSYEAAPSGTLAASVQPYLV